MGITLTSNFDVNAALPLDSRMVVADLTARDAIAAGRRFQGMCVYVIADTLTYQLKTGVLNTDWVEYGGGIAAATFVEKFSGDGGNLVFTLTNDPLAIENTMVFVDGVYQQKTTSYTLSTTDITFDAAPPIGVDNIEVMYTTPTGTLVIPDGYITTVHLADDAVTTDKILDGAITAAKLAALNYQLSSSSGSYSLTGTTSITDVTNLSVSITTTGRPVFVGLISDGTGVQSTIVYSDTQIQLSPELYLYRGATNISTQSFAQRVGGSSVYSFTGVPVSAVSHIDIPSAGTYTYKFSVRPTASTAVMEVLKAKLIAYEL